MIKTPTTPQIVVLLSGLMLLAGCSGPGPMRPPIATPAPISTPAPTPPPTATPAPTPPTTPAEPGDGPPSEVIDVSTIPDAIPQPEPYSKYGNPKSYVVYGKSYTPLTGSIGHVERGTASWYGTKFHGRRTSSGEPYNLYEMTAAHKTLPLPTYAQVTNLDNGRSVVVKINDRGPFHSDRIVDLSYAAAVKLGIVKSGTGRVELRAIDPYAPAAHLPQTGNLKSEPDTTGDIAAAGQNRFLQVGAFSAFNNAEKLRARLSGIATTPVMISKSDRLPPTYRVLIGPLGDDKEAQQLAERLSDAGITQTNLVMN